MKDGKPESESEAKYLTMLGWQPDAAGIWRSPAKEAHGTLVSRIYARFNRQHNPLRSAEDFQSTPAPTTFDEAYAASVYARWNARAQAPSSKGENA